MYVESELYHVEQEHKDDHESKEVDEGTKNMKDNEDEKEIEEKVEVNIYVELIVSLE